MQERDALLAGLAMLEDAVRSGGVKIDKEDQKSDHIGDLSSNGGVHKGLDADGIVRLCNLIVAEYPAPPVAAEVEA